MADDLKLPREGLTTLTIAFTVETIKRITDGVRKLHADGWEPKSILARMREEMPSFDPHTLSRLYDLALGRTIEDDFKREEIVSQKAVAQETFELVLAAPRKDLPTGAIVRFLGSDWFVKRASGTMLEVRRIV